jgi:hypothetical protein
LTSAGAFVGAQFQVNSYTVDFQESPSVASDSNGAFLVAWSSRDQDGDESGVFARRFDSGGNPLGLDFQVSAFSVEAQNAAAVACSPANQCVVTHEGPASTTTVIDTIFSTFYDAAGSIVARDVEIDAGMCMQGGDLPDVCRDAQGKFVVAIERDGTDGSSYGIVGQRFDSAGALFGTEFQVNSYTLGYQYGPSIDCAATGEFVVVWSSDGQDGTNTASSASASTARDAHRHRVPRQRHDPRFAIRARRRSARRRKLRDRLQVGGDQRRARAPLDSAGRARSGDRADHE